MSCEEQGASEQVSVKLSFNSAHRFGENNRNGPDICLSIYLVIPALYAASCASAEQRVAFVSALAVLQACDGAIHIHWRRLYVLHDVLEVRRVVFLVYVIDDRNSTLLFAH